MRWRITLGAATLAAVVLPGGAAGQDTASSWDELQAVDMLRHGDGVYVTDTSGQRIKGVISDVSSTGLTVTRGSETWTLTGPEITKLERQDPIWTGAVTGAGIGYGVVFAYCLGVNTVADSGYCLSRSAVYAIPFIAATAGLGALWDLSMHKTLYEATGDSRVAVAPMLGPERLGAQVSLTW